MEFYLDYLGFRVDWEHRFEAELPPVHRELSAKNYRGNRLRFNEDLK